MESVSIGEEKQSSLRADKKETTSKVITSKDKEPISVNKYLELQEEKVGL